MGIEVIELRNRGPRRPQVPCVIRNTTTVMRECGAREQNQCRSECEYRFQCVFVCHRCFSGDKHSLSFIRNDLLVRYSNRTFRPVSSPDPAVGRYTTKLMDAQPNVS